MIATWKDNRRARQAVDRQRKSPHVLTDYAKRWAGMSDICCVIGSDNFNAKLQPPYSILCSKAAKPSLLAGISQAVLPQCLPLLVN